MGYPKRPPNYKEVKRWRAFRGLTQKQAAKLAGVHPITWSRWERHPSLPSGRKAPLMLRAVFDSYDQKQDAWYAPRPWERLHIAPIPDYNEL